MSTYNTQLQSNNTDLQAILNTINKLPEASEGVDLPTLTNPAQSEEIFLNRETIDANGNIKVGTFTIDSELSTQSELLTELENILNTKAGGSGNGEASEWSENEDAIVTRTITSYTNDRVIKIGACAFMSCSNLTTVSFPQCTIISSSAFVYCSRLTTISFPKCTHIYNYAFERCTSLTTVYFPVCYSIGSSVFSTCSNLTTVSLPKCQFIGNGAFADCNILTTVSFPKCQNIPYTAFAFCSNLTTVSFPVCTNIGSYAFSRCRTFSLLTLGASSVCTLANSNAFSSTPFAGYSSYFSGTPHIYVPASLVDAYKSATNWVYFSSYITAIEDMEV